MQHSQPLEGRTTMGAFEQLITVGGRFSRRTSLVTLALAGVAGGVYLGWPSLVAAGLAPLILGLAPCAAMCALGLCANRMGQRSACSSPAETTTSTASNDPVATLAADAESPQSAADGAASRGRV